MKNKIFIFIILCLILPLSFVYAEKPEEFVNYLTKKIYKDCKGSDIAWKADSILSIEMLQATKSTTTLSNPDNFLLKWPYFLGNVKNILEYISSFEPFTEYLEQGKNRITATQFVKNVPIQLSNGLIYNVSFDGFDLISCKDKTLDVNGYTYKWSGEIIEVPKYSLSFYLSLGGVSISVWPIYILIRKRIKKRNDK